MTARFGIPIARRGVSRVAVSPSHVTLELTSLKDPLTSTVDLSMIESIDLGKAERRPHTGPRSRGCDNDRDCSVGRVTSCVGTPDGDLRLRMTGSATDRETA